ATTGRSRAAAWRRPRPSRSTTRTRSTRGSARPSPAMADRVVLITGGSTGIGAATARRAVAAGDRVVLAARRKETLDALAAELGPEKTLAVACDVTEWDQVEAVATAAL